MRTLATLLFSALAAFAQLDQGQITAVVNDATGGVVSGAHVEVVNEQTRLRRTAMTGTDGRAAVPALPPGMYSVEVEASGFKKYVQTGVQVVSVRVVAASLGM